VVLALPGFVVALVIGILIGRMMLGDGDTADATAAATGSAAQPTDDQTDPPVSSDAAGADESFASTTLPPVVLAAPPPDADTTRALAEALDLRRPSDCPLHLRDTNLLPNADREYRGGVHAGIDFLCDEPGREVTAAMGGRVVMAHDGFDDPSLEDRDAVLADAVARGTTPPWTLAMLYGSFVVLDHGQVDGVGHVATVYAHLESIAPGVEEGAAVTAGRLLGVSGNSGTSSGSRGTQDGIHLHLFLGAGLTPAEVSGVYSSLFPG
jgi:murein DD-endopeptidase MepM/ murein hydrolase activator NlpD